MMLRWRWYMLFIVIIIPWWWWQTVSRTVSVYVMWSSGQTITETTRWQRFLPWHTATSVWRCFRFDANCTVVVIHHANSGHIVTFSRHRVLILRRQHSSQLTSFTWFYSRYNHRIVSQHTRFRFVFAFYLTVPMVFA